MKKLLYTLALVALFNYSGFGQSACSGNNSVEFSNVPSNVLVAGQAGHFNLKVSVLTGSPGTLQYYSVTGVAVSGNTHTNSYTSTGLGTAQPTINFLVNSSNPTGTESLTVTVTVNNNGTACTVVGLTSFSTTPIELLAFIGKQTNSGAVKLNWVTASEKDNSLFMVERSNNGVDFTAVGEVKGAGNSSSNIDYTYTDASAINNAVNYYRLTDVDVNGKKSSSRVISVIVGKNAPLVIEAVSSVQGFTSVLSPSNGTADLTITDVQGRVLSIVKSNLVEGANTLQINTENLGTGIYFLNIVNNTTSAQTKFFKN